MDLLPALAFEDLAPWPAPERVALAFSGGADSVFLALAWRAWSGQLRPQAWIVDHGHCADSAERAAAAADLATTLDLEPRILTHRRGSEVAPGQGPSADAGSPASSPNEDDLRRRRYHLLGEQSTAADVQVLLTGHHADDQAETVLFRILRGTGLRGLAGVPARRELRPGLEVRRPLLTVRRDAIRAHLAAAGVPWLEDPSNADPACASRNRLRLEILPALTGVASADPVQALLRLQSDAAAWQECQEQLLDPQAEWRSLPSYLRRAAIAAQLRQAQIKVSPQRLLDLEGALMTRGSASINAHWRLTTSGGGLSLRVRRQAASHPEGC